MVGYVVTMSRCQYAQIVSQAYQPPPTYMLPLPSEKGFEAAQLGMKLVSAFEMVLARKDSHQAAGGFLACSKMWLSHICSSIYARRRARGRRLGCPVLWEATVFSAVQRLMTKQDYR